MGGDKSLIVYHKKAQCYEVYELLSKFCSKVFISCNALQAAVIDPAYEKLEDLPAFAGGGPATGVCTAFSSHPRRPLLVVGCDYPFLTEKEIRHFLASTDPDAPAAAFYDAVAQCYQPVLAWYSAAAGELLLREWDGSGRRQLSLQSFLKKIKAHRYSPRDPASMLSVDTPAAYAEAKRLLGTMNPAAMIQPSNHRP